MRILILDANVRYLNPTRNLMQVLLSNVGDVTFFGPGYVSSEILQRGIREFISKSVPFEVIICTEHFSGPLKIDDPAYDDYIKHYQRSFSYSFTDSDLRFFWNQMGEFEKLDIFKVCLYISYDFQQINRAWTKHIEDNFNLIGALNNQLWRPLCELEGVKYENFPTINDNWFNFVNNNNDRVVPLVNFVADSEFYYLALSQRYHDWGVLGAPYVTRKAAIARLKDIGIKCVQGKKYWSYRAKIESFFKLNPYASIKMQNRLNHDFFQTMRDTKYNFTCGSKLRYPIRKYFEIPASGSLLVCDPCNGFKDLGFENGENCFSCDVEDLSELNFFIRNNTEQVQQIALKGQKMVFKNHSVSTRADQLKKAIELGINNSYSGAFWENGKIVFNANNSK